MKLEKQCTRRMGVAALLAVVVLGCGGPAEQAAEPAAVQRLDVVLRDFAVEPERRVVPPGLTEFRAFNEGPTVHELILVRTDLGADGLPLQADGLTAVEEAATVEFVVADEGIDLGERGGFRAELTPGKYVLYCNLEGHYLGEMHADLEVREVLS
jgi:uncharacterized cupredoxin-like copper-binding protein